MSDILTKSKEEVVFTGQIIEVIRQTRVDKSGKEKVFEKAVRPPGVRLIIVKHQEEKILIAREYRYNIEDFDYRLPGGKVCDSITEYNQIADKKSEATKATIWESKQEAGIITTKPKLFTIANSGGPTIDWDLYYFVIDEFEESTQELEFGENISIQWLSFDEAIKVALSDKMREDRTVGVLMKYFRSIGKI